MCGPEKKFPYADDEFIRMWVADMEFAVAPEIREAIKERVDRKILGYTMRIQMPDTMNRLNVTGARTRYSWEFPKEELELFTWSHSGAVSAGGGSRETMTTARC